MYLSKCFKFRPQVLIQACSRHMVHCLVDDMRQDRATIGLR